MPVGGSDFGHLPPAGTTLDLQNKWIDGTYTFRSGAQMVSTDPGAVQLQGVNGTGTAPTYAAVAAGAGTGSSVGTAKGHDVGGSFVLTTAGSPAAGSVATVTFGTPLPAAPASVVVNILDTTASPNAPVSAAPGSITTTGFSIYTGALTTAHAYLVTFQVVAS